MRLIGLAVILALSITLGPLATEAQPAKVARIGYLSPLSASADSTHSEAFRQGLRDLGYVEGRTVVIEARYADGKFARLPDLAAEIIRLKVDVIVAAPTPAVRAAQQATRTVPIVMAFSGDPVGEGSSPAWHAQAATSQGFRPQWPRWRGSGWSFSRPLSPKCLESRSFPMPRRSGKQ